MEGFWKRFRTSGKDEGRIYDNGEEKTEKDPMKDTGRQ